jgi:hypothetical protein
MLLVIVERVLYIILAKSVIFSRVLLTGPEDRPIGVERCKTICHKNENT